MLWFCRHVARFGLLRRAAALSRSPASGMLAYSDRSFRLCGQYHMHAAPPRCTCRPPPALLLSLRLRAAWLAANSTASAVTASRARRYGRSAPLVAAAAAAAAGRPPGRAATTQQSSRAVEANRLLGFRALDLSSVPPKELGIVDDVSGQLRGAAQACRVTTCRSAIQP